MRTKYIRFWANYRSWRYNAFWQQGFDANHGTILEFCDANSPKVVPYSGIMYTPTIINNTLYGISGFMCTISLTIILHYVCKIRRTFRRNLYETSLSRQILMFIQQPGSYAAFWMGVDFMKSGPFLPLILRRSRAESTYNERRRRDGCCIKG